MDCERSSAVIRQYCVFPCAIAVVVLCCGLLPTRQAAAEPYLAVEKGMHCSGCHVHPAGGGMRNAYGNVFSQTELPARRLGGDGQPLWDGAIGKWISAGANVRGAYRYVDTPNSSTVSDFDVSRATIYVQANLVQNRLFLYVDQQVAPGGSINRETYLRYLSTSGKMHLAAGQFYLPYGLRLQDDTAFVRQFTGINFTNPDKGVQAGYTSGPWSTIVSLTNGTGGGAETDTGKQVSLITSYVRSAWRVGFSLNSNDADVGTRDMGNVFAGLRTGPVSWLAEANWIRDDDLGGPERDSFASLLEANWRFRKGHNLKLTHDWFDPDTDIDEDEQARWSVLWEYSPVQFVQTRFGVRVYDGIPQSDFQNRDEFFAELHGFF